MAQFQFRLKSLKQFRYDRLMKAQKGFSELNSRYLAVVESLKHSHQMRRECLLAPGSQKAFGVVKVFAELTRSESIKIEVLQVELRRLEREIEQYRSWMESLHREFKIVEKLEEKQRADFEEAKKKREGKEVDGWVVERWTRK